MPSMRVIPCQHGLSRSARTYLLVQLQSMKAALVKPLVKRHNLDCNVLNNYLPVSNLSYFSKITERAVAIRQNKYLLDSNLTETRQSAYRTGHITETALIRMKNDTMMSIDQSKAVGEVILDLSAGFDTLDHDVLFCRLEKTFWFYR